MSLRLRPYPAYRPSDLLWLGNMPSHWQIVRLKRIARLKSGQGIGAEAISDSGAYPVYGGNGLRGYASAYTHEGESVLIGRQGALCGCINYARGRFWATEHAVVAALPQMHSVVWFGELVRTMDLNQYSLAAAQPGLAVERIQNLAAPVPPPDEQTQIAAFLSQFDRRISRLVRVKRRMIELLNEQKQAIIHRAVTRGLAPNVPLKPSGIEWFGDVPEHWEIRRAGAIFRERNERGRGELPVLVVSLRTGVSIGGEADEAGRPRRLIEDRDSYKFAASGDIAYNMMRMWQGAIGVAPVDGLVSPAYVVAHPSAATNAHYFALLFRTDACMGEVNCISRGIVPDRNRLYWEMFKALPIPVPPSEEQDRIVEFIARRTRQADASIQVAEREIDLLREYRTRLVADVVTGKLDVRGVELDELPEDEALEAADLDEDESEETEDDASGAVAGQP